MHYRPATPVCRWVWFRERSPSGDRDGRAVAILVSAADRCSRVWHPTRTSSYFDSCVAFLQPTLARRNQFTSRGSVVPKLKWIRSLAEIPRAAGHEIPIVVVLDLVLESSRGR